MVLEDNLIYHGFKKYVQFYRNRLIGLENELKVARWEGWGEGLVREFGIDRYTLLYLKWITIIFKMDNQQGPTAHGTLQNVMGQPGWEGSLDTCICMAESLCHPPETITTLLITILQYKIKSFLNMYSFNSKA